MSTAARVGSINVVLNTTFGPAVSGLNTFATSVERTGQRTVRSVGGIDRSVNSMNRTMAGIGANSGGFRSLALGALRTRDSVGQMNGALLATSALLGGLIPTLSGAYLLRMADRALLVSNNLRTVTDDSKELRDVQEELFNIAQGSRSSLEATATIYARTARATKAFGTSQKDLLRITETINKSFAAGGANPAEAQGAAIQLTQGIASDRFSGDEFRSVAENAPILLKGIADSLGVNIGKLREMAHAGELTARVVTDAILRSSTGIDEAFDKTVSTIGQAVVKLDNAVLQYVSNSDNVSVAATGFVGVINAVSENLDTVTDSLLLLGGALLSTFSGRALANVVAYNRGISQQLIAQRSATGAALDRARAEAAAAAVQARASAQAILSAQKGVTTNKTLSKLSKQQVATANAHALATQRLTSATLAHAASLKAASTAGRVFAGVGRVASASWAFIGGPFGAALLAVGGAMFILQRDAERLESSLSRYADLIEVAGVNSGGSAVQIREAASALKDVAEFAGLATLQSKFNATQDDIARFKGELETLPFGFQTLNNMLENLTNVEFGNTTEQLVALNKSFLDGNIELSEYIDATNELASITPYLADKVLENQKFIESTIAAKERLEALQERMEDLDGTNVDIDINLRLNRAFGANDDGTFDIDQNRFGDGALAGDKLATEINKKLEADRRKRGIEKPKKGRKRKTEAQKDIEAFQKAINKLDYKKATFALSAIDEETIKIAKSSRVADVDIRAFIEGAKTGGEIPEKLAQIRNRLQEISDLEFKKSLGNLSETNVLVFLSDLDRKTIETARSFGVAESEVREFIRSASTGELDNIPEKLGRVRDALIDVTANERAAQGIDDIAEAFGSFASGAILDFGNIEDSVGGLLSQLANIYVQMVLIEPLIKSLKDGLNGGGGGGSFLSSLLSAFVPTNHSGGDAGVSNTGKRVSLSAFAGAEKFHTGKSGVGHGEVMALLEKSESVYTAGQNNRIADALGNSMGGLTAANNNRTIVEVELSQDLVARIKAEAEAKSVEITKKSIKKYDKDVLPSSAMRAVQKSVKGGKSVEGF